MAHALGLQCVAEGVEMESQLNFLNSNRCQEVQGYLLSKALSVPDFERWMDSWHSAHVDHKIA